jgi:proliferating cell nuclear antigen
MDFGLFDSSDDEEPVVAGSSTSTTSSVPTVVAPTPKRDFDDMVGEEDNQRINEYGRVAKKPKRLVADRDTLSDEALAAAAAIEEEREKQRLREEAQVLAAQKRVLSKRERMEQAAQKELEQRVAELDLMASSGEYEFIVRVSAAGFRNIIKAIKGLVTDVVLDVSDDRAQGMTVQAMCTSHVSLVNLSLPATFFEHYWCGMTSQMGINTGGMAKFLRNAQGSVELRRQCGSSELELLVLSDTGEALWSLPNYDIDVERLHIPDPPFHTTDCVVDTSVLAAKIADCDLVSDTMDISFRPEGMGLEAKGESGKFRAVVSAEGTEFRPAALTFNTIDRAHNHNGIACGDGSWSSYAISYLKIFMGASPLSSTIILRRNEDTPLSLSFPLDSDKAFLRFYLAPRIQEAE